MAKRKFVKADIIRDYLGKFPGVGPTELARKIEEENAGVKVRVQEISTIKSKLKAAASGGNDRKGRRVGNLAFVGTADRLKMLREAANFFGKDEAKRILDEVL